MAGDEQPDPLDTAEEVRKAYGQVSATLNGAVRELMADGWTEPQSRELVVALFVGGVLGRRS